MKRMFPLLALLTGLWLLPDTAAAQAQGGITCTAGIDDFFFGTVPLAGADITANVTWQCTRGNLPEGQSANIRMCFFISSGSAATEVNPRWMRQVEAPSQALISYDIFADSSRTQKVNPQDSGGPPMSFTMQLPAGAWFAAGAVPIYGRLYPQIDQVPLYHYSDQNLQVTPVRASYNRSGPPPSVDECLHGGGEGVVAIGEIDIFNVHAQIENICAIGIATDLDFGNVSSITGSHEQSSTIHLTCPSGTNWRLGLDNGLHPGASGQRRMANSAGTDFVPYELYRDQARQQRWGNTPETDTSNGTGTGLTQQVTVYGRTLAQPQTPPTGVYSDTITVTLTF